MSATFWRNQRLLSSLRLARREAVEKQNVFLALTTFCGNEASLSFPQTLAIPIQPGS
jgi:hypothetical protein